VIALYRRLVSRCTTINQINRVHIALENRLSPLEADVLRHSLRPKCHLLSRATMALRRLVLKSAARPFRATQIEQAREWMGQLAALAAPSGKRHPEGFQRRRIRRNVVLYSDGGAPADKTLAIAFTGSRQRLMMPVSVFLQHLDARRVEVVLLRDSWRDGYHAYRHGIPGVGGSIETLLDALPHLLSFGRYRKVVAVGTSGGGFPAVLAAFRLELDAVVSFGGNGPDDPRWVATDGSTGRQRVVRYRDACAKPPRVFLAFGQDCPQDRERAEALADAIPSRLCPVGDPTTEVGHTVAYALARQGKLTEFLQSTIFANENAGADTGG